MASRGTGTVNAIVSPLYSDVEGVTFAAGYQNDDDEKDTAGRPPHCIEIVVQGGSDEDVAGIIWENKSGGIRAYGSHYAYATDINGTRQYVEFTRVNDVYLLLSVKVTSAGGLDDDFEARIKSLLMEEILSAGTSVRLQKFIRPIMENVSGVDYIEIRGFFPKGRILRAWRTALCLRASSRSASTSNRLSLHERNSGGESMISAYKEMYAKLPTQFQLEAYEESCLGNYGVRHAGGLEKSS